MAVMYSKLGGCLGDTAKLGPLAKTDMCAGVKGLLDRLMTHFGLGSSGGDPWGSLLEGSGVGLPSWEPALSAWKAVLFPWEAWMALCLTECLRFCLYDLPAWLEGRLLPDWEGHSPAEEYVVASSVFLAGSTVSRKGGTVWTTKLLPSLGGRRVNSWEGNRVLPSLQGRWTPACLPGWYAAKVLPSPGGKVSTCLGM